MDISLLAVELGATAICLGCCCCVLGPLGSDCLAAGDIRTAAAVADVTVAMFGETLCVVDMVLLLAIVEITGIDDALLLLSAANVDVVVWVDEPELEIDAAAAATPAPDMVMLLELVAAADTAVPLAAVDIGGCCCCEGC